MSIQFDPKDHRLMLPMSDGSSKSVRAFKATWYNKIWLFFAKLSLTNPANFVECKNIEGESYLISRNSLKKYMDNYIAASSVEITQFINQQLESIKSKQQNIQPKIDVDAQEEPETTISDLSSDLKTTTGRTVPVLPIEDPSGKVMPDERLERNVHLLHSALGNDKIASNINDLLWATPEGDLQRPGMISDVKFTLGDTFGYSSVDDRSKNFDLAIKSTAQEIIHKYRSCKSYDDMWKYTNSSGLIVKRQYSNPAERAGVGLVKIITMIPLVLEKMMGRSIEDIPLSYFERDLKEINTDGRYSAIIQKLEFERAAMNSRLKAPLFKNF